MRPLLIFLLTVLASTDVLAWNAAGHRLSAIIAWQGMAPETRACVDAALRHHPDHGRWREKAGADDSALIFAEASTWPDSIRHDPRFAEETATSPLPGFPDMQRHSDWHYVDFDHRGKRGRGQLDRQIVALTETVRTTPDIARIAWALPWLAHLVADLHQPFHAGYPVDHGGNSLLVEDPADVRRPFVSLHTWWDDLPGKSGLRGKRLRQKAGALLAGQSPPRQGNEALWLRESRALLPSLYPENAGSVAQLIDATYQARAREIADRRISEAGWRLAGLLDTICRQRVSHETPREFRRQQ